MDGDNYGSDVTFQSRMLQLTVISLSALALILAITGII